VHPEIGCDNHNSLLGLPSVTFFQDMLGIDFGKLTLCIVLISVCFPSWLWLYDFLQRATVKFLPFNSGAISVHKHFVVIGINSARYNFDKRNAIRETWLGAHQKSSGDNVFVKFVLSTEDCDIPPLYRSQIYECIDANVTASDLGTTNFYSAYQALEQSQTIELPFSYSSVGIDFITTFDIVTKSLILPVKYSNTVKVGSNIKVSLLDLGNRNSLVFSETFSVVKSNEVGHRSIISLDVPAFLLPKGFQGSLVIQCPEQSTSINNFACIGIESHADLPSKFPGLVYSNYIRYSEDEDFPDFIDKRYHKSDRMVLPLALIYDIDNHTSSQKHLLGKAAAFTAWREEIYENKLKLKTEVNKYNDIIFVGDPHPRGENKEEKGLVDVYRNLSEKLLLFYKYAVENMAFDFIGKVDDDCYVDVDNLLVELRRKLDDYQSKDSIWFGSFRINWLVDRWGKWREEEYPSVYYPPFACGSGNILSHNLAEWLSSNSQDLHHYQGEDVSFGIWLSPLNPSLADSSRWICDDSCHPEMIVSAQNDELKLQELWRNKELCGNPCGCKGVGENENIAKP